MAPYIPKTLHSELSEYTSLIRALRTSNTLDVTLHLSQHKPNNHQFDNQEAADSGLDVQPPSPFSSPLPLTSALGPSSSLDKVETDSISRNSKRRSASPLQKRDLWTRWPLLANDVHMPAWGFEDEVAVIAAKALKHPRPWPSEILDLPGLETDDTPDLDVDDPKRPTYFKYLTASATAYLSTILALLAAHTPPRPPSMQNRIEPLDWRSVLEIVTVYGDSNVIDERIINKVTARMEALYFLSSGSKAPEANAATFRLNKTVEAEQQLANEMTEALESLFTFPEPPADFFSSSTSVRPKGARRSKRTIQTNESDVPQSKRRRLMQPVEAPEMNTESTEGLASGVPRCHLRSRPKKVKRRGNIVSEAPFDAVPSAGGSEVHAQSNAECIKKGVMVTVTQPGEDDKDPPADQINEIPPDHDAASVPSETADKRPLDEDSADSRQIDVESRNGSHDNIAVGTPLHSGSTRPRRAKATNKSYAVPEYFFDKSIMGGAMSSVPAPKRKNKRR
ncbi:hypothetical protein AMATHDRAFT_1088 [Amanita thiersii Skay4041]|uniref:Uncharacterized protein n=1 Tax=Amanita thiersii Skay4041 TaxID=703135 RepID=A0A2A9NZN2_9AGAR|nr:hypothetical protein AMATHDRAFT_1088 [Amanita thiersii Skay4041]